MTAFLLVALVAVLYALLVAVLWPHDAPPPAPRRRAGSPPRDALGRYLHGGGSNPAVIAMLSRPVRERRPRPPR